MNYLIDEKKIWQIVVDASFSNTPGEYFTKLQNELSPAVQVAEKSKEEIIHKGIEFSKTLNADNESYLSGAGFGYSCGYQDAMEQYRNTGQPNTDKELFPQLPNSGKELFEWVKASVGGKLNLPKEEFKVYPLRLDGNNYQTALFQSGKFSGFHPIHYNELEWLSPISQPVTVIGGAQFLSTFMEIWDEAKEGNYSADKWQQLYFSLWQSQPVKEDLFKKTVKKIITTIEALDFVPKNKILEMCKDAMIEDSTPVDEDKNNEWHIRKFANSVADFCKNNYCGEEYVQEFVTKYLVKSVAAVDAVLNDLTSMPDKEFEDNVKSIDYTKPLLLEMFPDNKPKHWALVDRITGKVLWVEEVKEQVEQACPHCDISPVRCKSCGEVI